MKLAVTDANIFIDLIQVDCLQFFFELGIELYTTHEVLEELYDEQKAVLDKYVRTGKLRLEYGFLYEREIKASVSKKLASADKSVFYLAMELKAGILTGDNRLKSLGSGYFEVHGILWIIQKFVDQKFLHAKEACQVLEQLKAFKSRLPEEECDKLLRRWGKKGK